MSKTIKVLFVDDEQKSLKEILYRCFAGKPVEFDCVGSITEAQAFLRLHHYDVTVVDLKLREESGFVLIEYIKREYPQMIYAVMSSSLSPQNREKAFSLGAMAFSKPIRQGQLIPWILGSIGTNRPEPVASKTQDCETSALKLTQLQKVGGYKSLLPYLSRLSSAHRLKLLQNLAILVDSEEAIDLIEALASKLDEDDLELCQNRLTNLRTLDFDDSDVTVYLKVTPRVIRQGGYAIYWYLEYSDKNGRDKENCISRLVYARELTGLSVREQLDFLLNLVKPKYKDLEILPQLLLEALNSYQHYFQGEKSTPKSGSNVRLNPGLILKQ